MITQYSVDELLISISFKMNTGFSYWESLKHIWDSLDMQIHCFQLNFMKLKYRSNVCDEILGAKLRYAKSV